MDKFTPYIDDNYQQFQDELFELLRLPSISPVPGFEKEVQACAAAFAEKMNAVGISAKVYQTEGNPIVYGETEQKEGLPTVLIYGHYDVQPEGNLDNWNSAPYEPDIRDGIIYARGVADNKGQIFSHIKAYEVYKATMGEPKVNLKYIIEGEEETGSVQLAKFAEKYADMLKADITIWSDGNVHSSGRPIILCGTKGLIIVKIKVTGPCRDFHSRYTSMLPSPVWKLTTILNSLKDVEGNVLVPGFYDGVEKPSESAIEAIRGIPGSIDDFKEMWGVDEILHGVETLEDFYTHIMYEPTLNCGCIAVGAPDGGKSIVPAEASAWLDIRPVPAQDHKDLINKIITHIESLGISGVEVEARGNDAAFTSLDNKFVMAATEAVRKSFNAEPVLYPAEGYSGPYFVFNNIIGAPCIMVPCSATDANEHGPNENLPIELYKIAIHTGAELIKRFSEE